MTKLVIRSTSNSALATESIGMLPPLCIRNDALPYGRSFFETLKRMAGTDDDEM